MSSSFTILSELPQQPSVKRIHVGPAMDVSLTQDVIDTYIAYWTLQVRTATTIGYGSGFGDYEFAYKTLELWKSLQVKEHSE
jgi:hypothetical protein